MREILFRGKRKDNNEWAFGYLFDDGMVDSDRIFIGGIVVEDYKGNADDRFDITGIDFCEVIPETVCQYTGLKDEHGKKIFEGDIVRDLEVYLVQKSYAERGMQSEECCEEYRENAKIGTVLFCTEEIGSCGCYFPSFEGSGFKTNDINLKACEIIGNIFDNSELIEK